MDKIKDLYYKISDLCRKYTKYDRAILWIITFLIHLIVIESTRIILMSPDEYNTIALPSFLSGNPISDGTSTMYHGWEIGILYTPFFFICSNGYVLYKCMLILNAVIASFIPVIAYTVLKKFFNYKSKSGLFFISLIAGIAPNNIFMSKFVWNETLVMFLTWFLLFLFLSAANADSKKKKMLLSALTGMFCAVAYGSHGRMLAACAAVAVLLIARKIVFKKTDINIPALIIGFAFFFIIDICVKTFVINNILSVNSDSTKPMHNTMTGTLSYMFDAFKSPEKIFGLLRAFVGDIFYDVFISYGAVLFGGIIFLKMLKKSKTYALPEKKNEFTAFFYGFTFLILAIIITVLFHSVSYGDDGVFDYIYGRYTENIAVLCMVLSIYYAVRYGIGTKSFIVSFAVMVLIFAWVYIFESEMIVTLKGMNISMFHIYTFYSSPLNYDSIFAGRNVIAATLLYIGAACVIIMYLFTKHKKFLPLLLTFVLLYIPLKTGNFRLNQNVESLIEEIDKSSEFFYSGDVSRSTKKYFYGYTLSLPKFLFYKQNAESIKPIEVEENGETKNIPKTKN